MNNDTLDYTKIKTVIYSSNGYWGSEILWNDASYAFQHRFNVASPGKNDDSDKWLYLGTNRQNIADKLGVEFDWLPESDYEYNDKK
jgi:hypothetical protein